uniref:DNA-directed RNA polymerase subunit beta'' n=1 Tax=Cibotium barometz TaxID=29588 RepID=A0A2S1PV46_CIBBA|nr:RNA polymerase beta'' subunit [Cibotium barometz]YP_010878713.1 RNA polymerase beta'' subunit [Cibotium cumingii]AWH62692.1 RNA polymerase beta'' subunit [Cibotium barometz]WHE37906.1 RNA polymerase beta'' subunit [Cibotium barometz]WHE37993.1 RNA polymerase beta'' subunit [Cibotium barometz]WHE38081.1 RNA polymerase beta'' subunit [Cibotium barometz]WHE38603.1 RNA polymerase beta'' subunit [Cibotium cumingii]
MADKAESPFYNKMMDKTTMRQPISKLVVCFGIASTTNILDQVKVLGFQQATKASVPLGIDDLSTVPSKGWLVQDAERQGYVPEQYHRYGSLHAVEKLRQSIEAWYATSECSKREMNPSFRMIDPLNPVHMMSFSGARGSTSQVHQLLGMRGLMSDPRGQVIDLPIRRNLREGLSLTEYIIPCYGARKGVVDTAVRTSDAGYLTRRLVEVVQHIVVRERDCETTKSIALNLIEERRGSIRTISYQRLIGRVLADNVYWDVRCIATRNQDIGDGLASNLVASTQSIHIRSPLTCKSIFWIRQLRYGWSLAHHNLVELGEAVGIIAGQSIGEPGTQSTLRTFHTGGVSTGDIAEYVRIPFNGLINPDERSVYPTRTRHGHPAWMCRNELPILIKSRNNIHNFTIPAQSLLMIRNDQYVESQQIIAEVRAKEFPLKERIQKSIYPNIEGETHWSRFVWHLSDCIDNPIRVVRETGHIWILSGVFNDSDKNYLFHEDQDRIHFKPHSSESRHESHERIGENINAIDYGGFQKGIQDFGINPKCFSNWLKPPVSTSIFSNLMVERGEEKEAVSLLLERQGKGSNESYFTNIDVHLNKILDRNAILAIYENSEHQTSVSGIIKYGTIEVESVPKKGFVSDSGIGKTLGSRYKVIKGGNSFLIPEEVYTIHEPFSSILVTNNTIIEEGTQITSTIISKVGGLIRIKKTRSSIEIRLLPGYIHNPERVTSIPKQSDALIAPGNVIFNEFKSDNWVYLQSVTLYRKRKTSVPVRPVVEYNISNNSLVRIISHPEKPKTQKCAKIEAFTYISYRNGEEVEISNHTTIQLVGTCLVVDWQEHFYHLFSTRKAYLSLTSVRVNNILSTFLQVNSISFSNAPLARRVRVNQVSQPPVSVDEPSPAQVDLSNSRNKSVVQYQSTVHSVSERGASFLILSPFNFLRNILPTDSSNNKHKEMIVGHSNDSQSDTNTYFRNERVLKDILSNSKYESLPKNYLNVEEGLAKSRRSDLIPRRRENQELGLLGTSWGISHILVPSHFHPTLGDEAPSFENSFVDDSTDTSVHRNWYPIDENELILKYPTNLFLDKYLSTKQIYLPPDSSSRVILLINLGLSISESRCFCRNNVCLQSGQVVAIHREYLLTRTAKPLLATRGAIIQKNSGDIIGEGDTLITLPHDRLRSGDTIQGLPKVEQLLESRSVASIPARIEDLFGRWNRGITRLIGNLWSHFLSAGTSMEHCQLVSIDQIRKVYGSQGVQISDKHLEIIIWQLTSRVVASEDGIANVFSPGELIEPSQAQRMNRVLKRSIFYEPIVLGMTKASLNTTSFLSEASPQETTRVLAKAALRGRIDRLKGLKENVIPGDTVPIGTGSQEIISQLKVKKQKEFHSTISSSKNSKWGTKNSLSGYQGEPSLRHKLVIHKGLNRVFSRLNSKKC